MQPTEGFSVSRRPLDIEDYIDVLRRHKGWIFGPFLLTVVASVVGAYLWPDTYVSSGIIKVEPQRLPTSMAPPVTTADMMDRINSMLEDIESKSSLAQIVTTYNLYPKERARLPQDDVLDDMKKLIVIESLGVQAGSHQVPAFRVSFSYPDRHLAQKVTQEILGKFQEANTRTLSQRTFESLQFSQDQADTAQKEMEAVEDRLAAYKIENNGRLPEQATTNYQKLTSLETSAASLDSQISRAQTDRMMYESQLSLYTKQADELAKIKPSPAAIAAQQQPKSVRRQKAESDVENWENTLRLFRQKYRETFPDVVTAKRELSDAQGRLDAIVKEESETKKEVAQEDKQDDGDPNANANTNTNTKESLAREAGVAHYQMQINADDNQIDQGKRNLASVNKEIAALQARLNAVPEGEKEYEDLQREAAMKREKYEEANKHLQQAQVQQDMENKSEGETLELLDPATLPESAASPKRGEVIGIGAGLGLVLGVVIAGFREMKDTSLKNLKDVRAYTQMAILGSIPLLENDFVVRRRRRLAWLGWTTACLAAVVLMSGSVVYWFSTRQ